jgi:hypothetical protein
MMALDTMTCEAFGLYLSDIEVCDVHIGEHFLICV